MDNSSIFLSPSMSFLGRRRKKYSNLSEKPNPQKIVHDRNAVDFSSGKLNIKFDDTWSMGGLATKGMFQREKIMAGQPPTPRVTKLPGLITHFNQEKPTVHKAGYFW